MPPPPDRLAGSSASASDALERAKLRVLERAEEEAAAVDREQLREEMDAVSDAVLAALDGEGVDSSATAPDRLKLIRSMRAALLWEWPEDDGSLLAVMRAFDAIEERLLDWGSHTSIAEMLVPFSRSLLREVAHLLRSPLGSIVMLTDGLRDGRSGPLTDLQEKQLGIVHRGALTAATIAGDLLSLVDDEHRLEPTARFRIAATLREVADVVRPVTETRGCELVVAQPETSEREGPATAIRYALLTMTLRAALMTRDGRVELDVEAEDGDVVEFTVTTDGVRAESDADAAEQLEILRLDDHSDSFTLSSNGLAITAARKVIEAMGSELRIGATPEGGVRMGFRLPLPLADH